MNALRKEIEADLGSSAGIIDIHNNPFFEFFSNRDHILHSPHVNDAILLFNTALNFLDTIPEDGVRELHVLTGDYLFSKFYMKIAEEKEYGILHDMMAMSKALSSRKSELAVSDGPPDPSEVEWLLFGPMLYLISNGYIDEGLKQMIDEHLAHLDIHSLSYINHK